MILISYSFLISFITILWIFLRAMICLKQKQVHWKRESQLLLVYLCIVVVARFTFFPFSKVNGMVQPLRFDPSAPLRINLKPFVYLFDYPTRRDALLNLIGNTAMFLPLGVIFPAVFRRLNTHRSAIAAGVCFSLAIEILQLPFCDRVSDIDDLILNSLGYCLGYLIYLLVKSITCKGRKHA